MGIFRNTAVIVCVSGIVMAILKNMLPSEKFSRQMNIIFTLVLILSVAIPLGEIDLDIDNSYFYEDPITLNSDKYNERFNGMIQENICNELRKILTENGIYPVNISADINISSDNSISIKGARIIITDSSDKEKTQRLLLSALGTDAEVLTEEEAK